MKGSLVRTGLLTMNSDSFNPFGEGSLAVPFRTGTSHAHFVPFDMLDRLLRAFLPLLNLVRNFIYRNGAAPAVLIAAAAVALYVSLRGRSRPENRSGSEPNRRDGSASNDEASARTDEALQSRRNRPVRLAGVRCVTIGGEVADGPIFSVSRDGVRPRVVIQPDVCDALCKLAGLVDLYIITRVENDEEEDSVRRALAESRVANSGFNLDKTVFCETVLGRVSIVR